MTARTSLGLYSRLHPEPLAPMPPPPPYSDDGYGGSTICWSPPRGTVRPHSESPFMRNVKVKVEEEERKPDLEAVACLLDSSMRDSVSKKKESETKARNTSPDTVTVRTFATSPRTPAAAP